MARKNRITVNLEPSEYAELLAMAGEHNISMAWLARQAIARFINEFKDKETQFPLNFVVQRRAGE